MRFSIVVPTQDRSNLLAAVIKHAMRSGHDDFDVIVSDNSTTAEHKKMNAEAVSGFAGAPNFRVVYPPRVLSPPEHFEFALQFATGDYVIYLTDKMVILPNTLEKAEAVIRSTKADIVNWAYAPYAIDDINDPAGSGVLTEEIQFLESRPRAYDPKKALQFKASGKVPRGQQQTPEYALGKIVFGCYSRDLIHRILGVSGTLFGGATHDYSAMVQALSMARKCVMLNTYGVLFISLPPDKSLGSLTAMDSQWAMRYFKSFTDSDIVIANLLVPGLYSSQHNMVAHDYKKFLPMYGNMHLFNAGNWLAAIAEDLNTESRIWSDAEEMNAQMNLFSEYLLKTGQNLPEKKKEQAPPLTVRLQRLLWPWLRPLVSRTRRKPPRPSFQKTPMQSLESAIQAVVAHTNACQRR
jgi:glycosyltransferase involved in cell wall biosynthesis